MVIKRLLLVVDAETYISDRFLRQLEEEGFVKRLWGK